MDVRFHKGAVVFNVTCTTNDTAAIRAALEKLVADTAEIIKKVKDAADAIIAEVNAVGDRVSTDVTELQRLIAEGGFNEEQVAALTGVADSLNAGTEKLKGFDPLPDFPPVEPNA